MKTFNFSGHSDDIFQVEGSALDEAYFYDKGESAQYKLHQEDEESAGVIISGEYTDSGNWRISIEPIDSDVDVPLKDWHFEFSPFSNGYHNWVSVTTPDNVVIKSLSEE